MPSWLDWLYESDPTFDYPSLPGKLTVPAPRPSLVFPDPFGGPGTVSPQAPPRQTNWTTDAFEGFPVPPKDLPEPDIDVSGGRSTIPVQTGTERTGRKSKLGTALLDILPRMATAAIAGAATPNVAGGQAFDFFRAAQAGREALDKRDINRLTMQQQAEQRAQQYALQASQMAENQAQGELYRAQAYKALQTPPAAGFVEKYDIAYKKLVENGHTPQEAAVKAAVIASGGSLQHMKPEKPEDPDKDKTQVTIGYPGATNIKPDAQGRIMIPNSRLQLTPPKTPAAAGNKLGRIIPTESGWTEVKRNEAGELEETPLKARPRPDKPKAARPRNQAPYQAIETRKDTALTKAKEKYDKAAAKIREGPAGEGIVWQDDPNASPRARARWHQERTAAAAELAAAEAELKKDQAQAQKDYLEAIKIQNAKEDDDDAKEEFKAQQAEQKAAEKVTGKKVSRWGAAGSGHK